jgi:two-component system, NtrC family, nitrogen regulation response regulator NtrX
MNPMTDSVLIVDDEESVRRTFQDWLEKSGLPVRVFAAADAEGALRTAAEYPIDLAILDWNLGSGSDGLKLLEDLVEFHPDVVAILITGFAHQATPLDALRMGVRDYIDKNHDLNRDSFLAAVNKQLVRIHPIKRQREFSRSLAEFREAVEKVLPIVQTAAAFNDPVPLPAAVKSLLRFLLQATRASDGVLLVHHETAAGTQNSGAYDSNGELLPAVTVPFNRSLAAAVVSSQEPVVLNDLGSGSVGTLELMSFETGRKSVLAAPLTVSGGTVVVLELFDKPAPGFGPDDRRLVAAAAEIGGDLLRQAIAERHTHRLLFDAVETALRASSAIHADSTQPLSPDDGPSQAVLERLRQGLDSDTNAVVDASTTLQLVDAVRQLAVRHGPIAVEHCIRLVNELRSLLDGVTGAESGRT